MGQLTDEQKASLVAEYEDGNPTPENTMELVQELAEQYECSPNAARMALTKAGVYVKKEAAKPASKAGGDKPKRKGKAEQQAELVAAIEAHKLEADSAIVEKLTGKAAEHFAELFNSIER